MTDEGQMQVLANVCPAAFDVAKFHEQLPDDVVTLAIERESPLTPGSRHHRYAKVRLGERVPRFDDSL